jgi:hypothetical protein
MEKLELLTPDDLDIKDQIVKEACENIRRMHFLPNPPPASEIPASIGRMGFCMQASDAVTRAAHSLGIMASRDLNSYGGHFYTAFSAPDQPPSEDDLILCMTWGQFNHKNFNFKEFFGPRQDIAEYVGDSYAPCYEAGKVTFRQVSHAPNPRDNERRLWLATSWEDVSTGSYPIGAVKEEDFPKRLWL